MNKGKLRSLMFHAGFCKEDGGWDYRPIWEQEKDNFQRFAESIVRECIASIENADNGFEDYRNQIEDGMRNHCIDLIKNKFGVEE